MSLPLLVALGAGWAGTAVLLAETRWFRHRHLAERLAPYQSDPDRWRRAGRLSLDSVSDILTPLVISGGEALARAVGITDSLSTRLARIGDRRTAVDFRLRQAASGAAAFGAGLTVTWFVGAPPAASASLAVILPMLTFLALEQRITSAGHDHRARIERELPVVAEQLAMLLQAGYSLTAALRRLSERGTGTISTELAVVVRRGQQGLTAVEALQEWSDLMAVESLCRVVAICALDHEMSDIGPLMSDEARAIRQQSQRRLVEHLERRNQQIWIPVTVATLVPGVILLAVPFVDALRTFSVGP